MPIRKNIQDQITGKCYPREWAEYLADNYKVTEPDGTIIYPFAQLKKKLKGKHFWPYCYMCWEVMTNRNHRHYADCSYIPLALVTELMNSERAFNEVNGSIKAIEIREAIHLQGIARGLKPTLELRKAYRAFITKNDADHHLVMPSGKTPKTLKNGISPKHPVSNGRRIDMKKNTAWIDDYINPLVKVSPTYLKRAIKHLDAHASTPEERRLLNYCHSLKARIVRKNGGSIPTVYFENTTGRVFVFGSDNLQNVPRECRKIALAGNWDIDLENCHFALIYQLIDRLGADPLPTIGYYLKNKQKVRLGITADIGAPSIKQVKSALLALAYGAQLGNMWGDSGIPDAFEIQYIAPPEETPEEALQRKESNEAKKKVIKAFYAHPEVKALHAELDNARDWIIDSHLQGSDRGLVVNAVNKTFQASSYNVSDLPRKEKGKLLAFILQGYEALILQNMIDYLQAIDKTNVLLAQHDGLTIKTKLTEEQIHRLRVHLMTTTGFCMDFSQDQLVPEMFNQLNEEGHAEPTPFF